MYCILYSKFLTLNILIRERYKYTYYTYYTSEFKSVKDSSKAHLKDTICHLFTFPKRSLLRFDFLKEKII